MNVADIISNALIEYDTARPVINFLQKTHTEGFKTSNDWQRTNIRFMDPETKELIVDTETEVLAIYYDKFNVWSWAWSHIGLTNAENYLSKETLLYSLKLGSELAYLKSIITTSRSVIKNTIQLEINLAIASSIIKQPYIYPYVYTFKDHKLTYYYILLNKLDLTKLNDKITFDKSFKENDKLYTT